MPCHFWPGINGPSASVILFAQFSNDRRSFLVIPRAVTLVYENETVAHVCDLDQCQSAKFFVSVALAAR